MVKGEQQHADEQKADKLTQHDGAAGQQSGDGLPRSVGAKVALDQILISAMRAHRQEATAYQAGPESKRLRKVKRKIEERKLIKLRSVRHRGAESAVDFVGDNYRGGDRTGDVDAQLDNFHPNHGFHPAKVSKHNHRQAEQNNG